MPDPVGEIVKPERGERLIEVHLEPNTLSDEVLESAMVAGRRA